METEIFVTGPIDVNTYILKDGKTKEAVLIDVGGSYDEIKSKLDAQGYTIKFILNTHGHFDHILGEPEIQRKNPEIPIYMHRDDYAHVKNLKKDIEAWGFDICAGNLKISEFIDENTDLKIGGEKIRILYTPGHSKGSLSYYIDGKLFSGDALFYGSIGRTDFFDGDYDTLINSIKSKIMNLPEATVVYPGHGPSTTIFREKNCNTYLL